MTADRGSVAAFISGIEAVSSSLILGDSHPSVGRMVASVAGPSGSDIATIALLCWGLSCVGADACSMPISTRLLSSRCAEWGWYPADVVDNENNIVFLVDEAIRAASDIGRSAGCSCQSVGVSSGCFSVLSGHSSVLAKSRPKALVAACIIISSYPASSGTSAVINIDRVVAAGKAVSGCR